MLVRDHALAGDSEAVAEQWLRETLAPDLALQHAYRVQIHVGRFQRAVGLDAAREIGRGDEAAHRALEQFAKLHQAFAAYGEARGGGMTAEAQDQARRALGDEIERVAQMQA